MEDSGQPDTNGSSDTESLSRDTTLELSEIRSSTGDPCTESGELATTVGSKRKTPDQAEIKEPDSKIQAIRIKPEYLKGGSENNSTTALKQKLGLKRTNAPSLYRFSKPLASQVLSRFKDLEELLFAPMCEKLDWDESRCRMISLRLELVGIEESQAKPCIFVLCHSDDAPKLRKFLLQKHVKAHLKPSSPGGDLPSFSWIVGSKEALAPEVLAACGSVRVCTEEKLPTASLCGARITTDATRDQRSARIGGPLMVTYSNGDTEIFGMTVRHIFGQLDEDSAYSTALTQTIMQPPHSNISNSDIESHEEDEGDIIFWDAEMDTEFTLETLPQSEPLEPGVLGEEIAKQSPERMEYSEMLSWPCVGRGPLELSGFSELDSDYLDYALIRLYDVSRLRHGFAQYIGDESALTASEALHGLRTTIAVASPNRSPTSGNLTFSRSFLRMQAGGKVIETYLFRPDKHDVIKHGDSGAWVVDCIANRAWGHVVAADGLGDVYVIPMAKSMKQMRQKLDATSKTESISLPSDDEIHRVHNNQTVSRPMVTSNFPKESRYWICCSCNSFQNIALATSCITCDHAQCTKCLWFVP